jgi:DNA-binding SARP family transcriptional activator
VLAIAGVKPRAILSVLGLYAGDVVAADTLVGVLWGDEPPPGASRALQTHVSALRRALGDEAVLSRGAGWRVVADPVDARVFQVAARAGRQAAREGDPAGAVTALGEALASWRGAPQLPATRRGEAEVTRWVEDQRAVADEWADAVLACGRPSDIIGVLEAAVAEAPLREHRWAQLMLALYRVGRQGEALRTYQRARHLLAEELGLEPGPELRELELRLLAQDPQLDWRPTATQAAETRPPPLRLADTGGPVPLPARLELVPPAGFVGRRDELNTIGQTLKVAASQRQCRMVLVGGEPGVGKTALAAEFARIAHDDGAIVLYGRCEEELAVPYKPWADALTHLLSHAPEGLLASIATHARFLVQVAPALADSLGAPTAPTTSDLEGARYLMFDAVAATLRGASGLAPVVVCLDDLQWADAASLQLLRHVVAASEPTRLLVVATFRDSEVGAALADLLAASRREPSAERVSLGGFDEAELLAFIERAAGYSLGDAGLALRDALLAETDGNPFFVGELLHHLADTGAVYPHDGRFLASTDLRRHASPVGVREVIGRRVARLGEEATRLLSIASVIGREFDLRLLVAVSGLNEDAVLDVMDHAVEASLVDNFQGNRYSFVHALVEHSVYDSLSAARRTRLHLRVGEVIETQRRGSAEGRAVELARHFALADGPDALDKAVHYAEMAGDAALARLAPDEALRSYAQAISVLGESSVADDQLRCRLLVGLGDAQRQTGHPAFRQTLLDAAHLARSLGSNELLVAAALANDRGWLSAIGTVDTERVAVLEAACTALEGVESAERARILALLATELLFGDDFTRQRALADEAMVIARGCDPAVIAFTANRISVAIAGPDTLAECLALTREAVEAAQRAGDPILRFWSAIYRSAVLRQAGEVAEAGEHLVMSRTIAERLGQPLLLWSQTFREAQSAMLTGDLEDAERLATRAVAMGSEIGQPDAPVVFATQLGPIRSMQGRSQEILDIAALAAAQNPALPAVSTFLAQLYYDLDRHEEAREVLEPLFAERFAPIIKERRSGSLIAMAYAAYATSGIGWSEAAETLYEALRPFADQIPVAFAATTGCQTSYYLALLAASTGRGGEAERYFSQAVATHERIGAAWGLTATQLAWGQFLLDRAKPEDVRRATVMLEAALDDARLRGYQLLERRARRALGPGP